MGFDPLELAYLAGVVDADGFISVQRSRKPQRIYYAARVAITGAERQPHDIAATIFGGKVRRTIIRPEHRPQFVWMLHGTKAVPVLQALAPYLRIKARQAQIALALQDVLAVGYDADRLDALRVECADANHRARPQDWATA